MSLLLIVGQEPVADLEHVRVVPVAISTHGSRLEVRQEVGFHALPDVAFEVDVLSSAPGVRNLRSPLRHVLVTPVADRVVDRMILHGKSIAHCTVALSGRHARIEAVVELEVVDAPAGEIGRISRLVVEATCSTSAGLGSGGRVDTELESRIMDVIAKSRHA